MRISECVLLKYIRVYINKAKTQIKNMQVADACVFVIVLLNSSKVNIM